MMYWIGILLILIIYIIWKIVAQPQLTVSTDKTSYLKGQSVGISGTLTTSLGGPISGVNVNLLVVPPVGDMYTVGSIVTQSDGSYSTSWSIPTDAVDGTYTLRASALGLIAESTFTHMMMRIGYGSRKVTFNLGEKLSARA